MPKKWTPNVTPLNESILIERPPAESVSPGGIILPESSQEKQARGTVVALYDDQDGDCPVALGDVVMYGKYDGTDMMIDGHDCVMVKRTDLSCRIDGE